MLRRGGGLPRAARASAGHISAVAVADGLAHLGSAGVFLVADISDPSAPPLLGEATLLGYVVDVGVAEDDAHVADGWRLHVIEVSTASVPVEVGFIDTPGWTAAVAVSDSYVYVVDATQGLRVIDARWPAAPVDVGLYPVYLLPYPLVAEVVVSDARVLLAADLALPL